MRRLIRAAAFAVLVAALPAAVAAHPLGNFSINHYAGIRISPMAVDVDLVIDMAEIPALDAIAAFDANGNGAADAAELDAERTPACQRLAGEISIIVAGDAVMPQLTAAGMQVAPGAAGLKTVRTVCELRATLPAALAPGTEIIFLDGSYPERIGWREIVVVGDGATVATGDADVSRRLTAYPADLLRQPLNERSVSISVSPGGAAIPPWVAPDAWALGDQPSWNNPASPAGVPGGVAGELSNLIDFTTPTLPLVLLGLVVAAIAGAGHALSPGHGKTVMAAYLIASRGSARQAVLLGTAVTISHTLGVLLLAAVVLLAGSVLPPDRLYPILTVASGAMVVAIGAALLIGCIRRLLLSRAHGHSHAHDHEPGVHLHGMRVHSHTPVRGPLPGWRGLAALGIAGGLVPSTSALILLLGAIGAGQPAYGVALAVAFGAGMAVVLTGIGLALVHGRGWVERLGTNRPALQRVGAALPWVTAVVVLAGGLVLTGQTLVTTL